MKATVGCEDNELAYNPDKTWETEQSQSLKEIRGTTLQIVINW